MNGYGGMKPRGGQTPDFTIGKTEADALTKQAAKQMGRPQSEIKRAVESGNLSDIMSGLSDKDAKRLNEILSDEKKLTNCFRQKRLRRCCQSCLNSPAVIISKTSSHGKSRESR